MFKKIVIILAPITIFVLGFTIYKAFVFSKELTVTMNPILKETALDNSVNVFETSVNKTTKVSKDKPFNILLLGIDRRSKQETNFRSDIMILMSVNQNTKKVVFTSVPRDLWYEGERINALYNSRGWEATQSAFETITDFKPDAFIQSDFEDLIWIVDSFGGVKINLDNSFTDTRFPNDATKTYMTVSYTSGEQLVDGKNALILSRSRHGNNGEGSDFMRMKRQHKILTAMPEAILSPKSIFNPFNIVKFFELVTQHMVTDLTLDESKILWSFYENRKDYVVEDLYLDSNFLINPPMSDYGGAWVLIPQNSDYTQIHNAIKEKLGIQI